MVDDKGNVVKAYEPFYADNPDYEYEADLATAGVTATVTYDPLGRAVQVDLPNGTRRRVSFTPWSTTTWDEADCAGDSDLSADPDLLARAAAHVDTPARVAQDAQGRAYETEEMPDDATTFTTTTVTLEALRNPRVLQRKPGVP